MEVAEFLLDRGADIDALDVDHESTPAQWMLRDRQDVARYLVGRGCRTDLLMAAALGDVDRVRGHLDAEPGSIRMSVTEKSVPQAEPAGRRDDLHLDARREQDAHVIAREFGHDAGPPPADGPQPDGAEAVAGVRAGG